jgi:hypothetical protein
VNFSKQKANPFPAYSRKMGRLQSLVHTLLPKQLCATVWAAMIRSNGNLQWIDAAYYTCNPRQRQGGETFKPTPNNNRLMFSQNRAVDGNFGGHLQQLLRVLPGKVCHAAHCPSLTSSQRKAEPGYLSSAPGSIKSF